MIQPLFAFDWEVLFGVVFFVISGLLWVINRFAVPAGKPKAPPQRRPAGGAVKPQPGAPAPRAADPLQAEIEEFLRQAQARREGKPAPQPPRAPVAMPERREPPPQPQRGNEQRGRPPRRTTANQPKRGASREETRPVSRPVHVPLSSESHPVEPKHRSLVSDSIDGERFSERTASLSRMREHSDSEFQSHMSRVFDRDLGTLNTGPLGMFEAAGATAKAATLTAAAADVASAGGNQSASAPNAIRRQTSDIALFLAGRKNIRDAIILNEILKRPEW
jgi:hypothetical protein